LGVCVYSDELNAAQVGVNHSVDGVYTSATYTYYFDRCEESLS
jgi:hypothetical protein